MRKVSRKCFDQNFRPLASLPRIPSSANYGYPSLKSWCSSSKGSSGRSSKASGFRSSLPIPAYPSFSLDNESAWYSGTCQSGIPESHRALLKQGSSSCTICTSLSSRMELSELSALPCHIEKSKLAIFAYDNDARPGPNWAS
jgi:hypothetical protein